MYLLGHTAFTWLFEVGEETELNTSWAHPQCQSQCPRLSMVSLFTPHRHQQPDTWSLLAWGLRAVMFGTWLQPEREPLYCFSKSVYSFQMTECSELLSQDYWGFIPRSFCSFLLVLWYSQGGNWCSSFIVEKGYPGVCQKQVNDVGLLILILRETVL